MAAVSAEGSTVWVFIRRLNSSWSRSIALVVRALFHWLRGNRVKVKSRSPASSRLSATALASEPPFADEGPSALLDFRKRVGIAFPGINLAKTIAIADEGQQGAGDANHSRHGFR